MYKRVFICLGWSHISVGTDLLTLPFSKIAVISTRKKHYHVIKFPSAQLALTPYMDFNHLSHEGLCKQCCETVL